MKSEEAEGRSRKLCGSKSAKEKFARKRRASFSYWSATETMEMILRTSPMTVIRAERMHTRMMRPCSASSSSTPAKYLQKVRHRLCRHVPRARLSKMSTISENVTTRAAAAAKCTSSSVVVRVAAKTPMSSWYWTVALTISIKLDATDMERHSRRTMSLPQTEPRPSAMRALYTIGSMMQTTSASHQTIGPKRVAAPHKLRIAVPYEPSINSFAVFACQEVFVGTGSAAKSLSLVCCISDAATAHEALLSS
mmetsp:Transcript_52827/g.104972  ORF Transcript_52827/g.104972 Transcript_52827/m.104972 type:complete len:251 (-) Transcript_52827:259-1011(-)